MIYRIAIKDKKFDIEISDITSGVTTVNVNGKAYDVTIENYDEVMAGRVPSQSTSVSSIAQTTPGVVKPRTPPVRAVSAAPAVPQPARGSEQSPGAITAPIPGRIMTIQVQPGDIVKPGQTVATMEAMKMENNVVSNTAGTVKEIRVQQGSEVSTGDVIMIIG